MQLQQEDVSPCMQWFVVIFLTDRYINRTSFQFILKMIWLL